MVLFSHLLDHEYVFSADREKSLKLAIKNVRLMWRVCKFTRMLPHRVKFPD